jgi:hypothetical protein
MTVYVIHDHRVSRGGRLVSKYDLTPALQYGTLEFLITDHGRVNDIPRAITILEKKLADFNDKDNLLLLGSPVLIGLATAIAVSNNHGRAKLLQWHYDRYAQVQVALEGYDG